MYILNLLAHKVFLEDYLSKFIFEFVVVLPTWAFLAVRFTVKNGGWVGLSITQIGDCERYCNLHLSEIHSQELWVPKWTG